MYAQAGFGLGWGLERGDCDLRVDEDTATRPIPPPTSKAPNRPDFHRGLGFARRFARKGREIRRGCGRSPLTTTRIAGRYEPTREAAMAAFGRPPIRETELSRVLRRLLGSTQRVAL
jgi:hypothetical protein